MDAALAIAKNLSRRSLIAASRRGDLDGRAEAGRAGREARLRRPGRGQAAAWRSALDPDGARAADRTTPREAAIHASAARTLDGLTPFSGLGRAGLRGDACVRRSASARRRRASPRFLVARRRPARGVDSPVDSKSTRAASEQRAYDVLAGLLTAGIRADSATRRAVAQHGDRQRRGARQRPRYGQRPGVARRRARADLRRPRRRDRLRLGHHAHRRRAQRPAALDGPARTLLHRRSAQGSGGARRRMRLARAALRRRPGVTPTTWSHGSRTGRPTSTTECCSARSTISCSIGGEYRMRMVEADPQLLSPKWIDPEQQWRPVGRPRWSRAA